MLQSSLLVLASLTLCQAPGRDETLAEALKALASMQPNDGPSAQPIGVLGMKALRTGGAFHALAYVDGDRRIVGAWEGTIELWQDDANLLQTTGFSRTMSFPAPDGETAARVIEGKRIVLWDIHTGKEIRQFRGEAGPIAGVVWSPCGKLLAAGVGPVVFLWDAATGKVQQVLTGDSLQHPALAFSLDGTKLAGGDREAAQIWDVDTGAKLATLEGGFSGGPSSVAFSPDGKVLVGCCRQDQGGGFGRVGVRQWNAVSGKTIRDLEFGSFNSVVISPDGNDVYAGADRFIYRWHLHSGKQVRRWLAHNGAVRRLAVTRDGKVLSSAGSDLRLRSWRIGSADEPAPGHVGPVLAVAFSPDGRTIASGGEDRTLRFWDAASGKQLRRCPDVASEWGIGHLAFAPDGKTLVTAERQTDGSTLRLWNVDAGTQMAETPAKTQGPIAFAPGGRWLLAAAADGKVGRWHPRALLQIGVLPDFGNPVAAVSLSSDGRILAWQGAGSGYGVRDLKAGVDLLRKHDQASSVTLSGDGILIAAHADCAVVVWDVANGVVVAKWTSNSALREGGLVFSPDGRLLAGATKQGVVLREAVGGAAVAALPSDQGGVTSIAFAPHGRTLVSGTEEGAQLLWAVNRPWQADKAAATKMTTKELLHQVNVLRGGDAVKAQTAIWTLAAAGPEAVPLVESVLPGSETARTVKRLIRDLSDPVFTVRDQAMKQLSVIADDAELGLLQSLANSPDLETRRRVELLLRKLEQAEIAKRPVQVRRALAVLEYARSKEARSALERFARTAPHDPWIPTVQAILKRWGGSGG